MAQEYLEWFPEVSQAQVAAVLERLASFKQND